MFLGTGLFGSWNVVGGVVAGRFAGGSSRLGGLFGSGRSEYALFIIIISSSSIGRFCQRERERGGKDECRMGCEIYREKEFEIMERTHSSTPHSIFQTNHDK